MFPTPFKIAQKQSRLVSKDCQHSLSAAIFNKRPCSRGHNSKKTHPIVAKYSDKPSKQILRAEIDAILKCNSKKLKGSTLYVYRESHGKPALAKPCSVCMKLIKMVGIKKIYYTKREEPYFDIMVIKE